MARMMRFTSFWMTVLLITGTSATSWGQDTLPAFSAQLIAGKKARISWVNPYAGKVKQISIQRSRDSLRLFNTIGSITHPTLEKNEFIDKSPNGQYFYRLYILLEGERYVFSVSRKAGAYAVVPNKEQIIKPIDQIPPPVVPKKTPEKINKPVVVPEERSWTLKRGMEIVGTLKPSGYKAFRDSLLQNTKDTLGLVTTDTIFIKPFQLKDVYKPSRLVFFDKNGLLHLEMPDPGRKSYQVRFYEEDRSFLFEVKSIRDPMLLLEKANFGHAGWFLFEVFEDGRLIEKNRVFLTRDF